MPEEREQDKSGQHLKQVEYNTQNKSQKEIEQAGFYKKAGNPGHLIILRFITVALFAVQLMAKMLVSSCFGDYPRTQLPGRVVPNMLVVTAC
jgi:hypothetical protein